MGSNKSAFATPMMRQWAEIKAAHVDCIVFFRLGDFYEAFSDDAEAVAEICDVTLTSRPVKKGARVPMAGVPYHAADAYIAQLVKAGRKVAIVEQMDAQDASKRARMSPPPEGASGGNGKLVEREVVRVVTRGTLLEPELIDARTNNYAAAVVCLDTGCGLAYADVSTGQFATTQLEDLAAAVDEIARLRPAEVLVPDGDEGLSSAVVQGAARLGFEPTLSPLPLWQTDVENARRELKDHFGVATLAGFGCEDQPAAIAAAGGLMAYLRSTQKGSLLQITSLETYRVSGHLVLDPVARRNLEIATTLRGDRRKGTLLWAIDATLTPMGGRLLNQRLEAPLVDVTAIGRRLDAVESLHTSPTVRASVREGLKTIGDLERLTNRAVSGYAGPRELGSLADGVASLPDLAADLEAIEELPEELADTLTDIPTDVADRIRSALVDDPPAVVTGGETIRPGYDAALDRLNAGVRDAREWIAGLEKQERDRTGIKALKVGFNKVFGYYLEVPKRQSSDVPDDYQRKQTLANAERYITPELKEKETEVLQADERIAERERELYRDLLAAVSDERRRLLRAAVDVAVIDVAASLAEVAASGNYVRPEVDDSKDIEIRAGRHPVVERMRRDVPFVPNDIAVREGELLILTGPNMAGKSTVLRQVALIALMAQAGSFVPADSARIGWVDRIFTRIGAQDEIAVGQSTFMVEMVETAQILNQATARSLVILDELGRGTSTYDGMAIAWAVIEHLHDAPDLQPRTLFATHYHELTALEEALGRVRNLHMAVRESGDGVEFLHRIETGSADRSYGIHVGQLAGLPAEVVQRAWQLLERLERSGAAPIQPAKGRPADAGGQLPLFAPAPEDIAAREIVERLESIDPNQLTPLEALRLLAELKGLSDG